MWRIVRFSASAAAASRRFFLLFLLWLSLLDTDSHKTSTQSLGVRKLTEIFGYFCKIRKYSHQQPTLITPETRFAYSIRTQSAPTNNIAHAHCRRGEPFATGPAVFRTRKVRIIFTHNRQAKLGFRLEPKIRTAVELKIIALFFLSQNQALHSNTGLFGTLVRTITRFSTTIFFYPVPLSICHFGDPSFQF